MCWNRFQSRWTLWSWYLLGCPAFRFIKPLPVCFVGIMLDKHFAAAKTQRAWSGRPDGCTACHEKSHYIDIFLGYILWNGKNGYKYVYKYICLLYIIFIGENLEKLHNSDVTNSSFCIVGSGFVFRVFIACTFYSFRRADTGLGFRLQHSIAGWFWMLFNFSKFQIVHLYKWK